jgi:hypothetical protein
MARPLVNDLHTCPTYFAIHSFKAKETKERTSPLHRAGAAHSRIGQSNCSSNVPADKAGSWPAWSAAQAKLTYLATSRFTDHSSHAWPFFPSLGLRLSALLSRSPCRIWHPAFRIPPALPSSRAVLLSHERPSPNQIPRRSFPVGRMWILVGPMSGAYLTAPMARPDTIYRWKA